MNSWLKEIVVLFIIISMVDIIIPKGKMKRYVNFIIGLLIIFTIISPITRINNISLDLDKAVSNFTDNSVQVTSMEEIQEEQIKKLYISNLKNELIEVIEENFNYEVADLKINVIPDKEQIFIVDSIDLILSGEISRDNKQKIKVEKIELEKEVGETISKDIDNELAFAISNYLQIEQEKINVSIIDKGDKNGRNN
jgi:stage III sporulation protein AF